jgi:hypothetical protein
MVFATGKEPARTPIQMSSHLLSVIRRVTPSQTLGGLTESLIVS